MTNMNAAASNPAAELTEAELDLMPLWSMDPVRPEVIRWAQRILAARLAAGGAAADEGLIRAAQASALREAELEIRDAKTLDVTTKAVVCARLRSRARALDAAPAPTEARGVEDRMAEKAGREFMAAQDDDLAASTVGRADDTAAVAERAEHRCITKPLCDGWPFGVDDAYRTIAAVAWPAERVENRDGWAVTMRHRPGLFEQEAARAQERLTAAIAHGRAALAGAPSAPAEDQGGEGK